MTHALDAHGDSTGSTSEIERVFHAWDEALGAKDIDAAMALYAADVTLESPLICHLLGTEIGIIRGRDELRRFVTRVFEHQPPQRRRFRTGYFTDGARLTWEYPRAAPDGDQMDIVEVMEVSDGVIQHHLVFWGWFSVTMLTGNTHPR